MLDAGDPHSYCMNACELPTMTIVRQHMWGVAHEGPYYLSKIGSPQDRVTHVRRFQQSDFFTSACIISHAQQFTIYPHSPFPFPFPFPCPAPAPLNLISAFVLCTLNVCISTLGWCCSSQLIAVLWQLVAAGVVWCGVVCIVGEMQSLLISTQTTAGQSWVHHLYYGLSE